MAKPQLDSKPTLDSPATIAARENSGGSKRPGPVEVLTEQELPDDVEYMVLADWRRLHGSVYFPNDSSLTWFLKWHRQELVDTGAIITRGGRSPSLAHRVKMQKIVIRILQRKAKAKAVAISAAA
ncbi:MAG: hypothetical protein WA190_00200 [Usitatibacter sp.]